MSLKGIVKGSDDDARLSNSGFLSSSYFFERREEKVTAANDDPRMFHNPRPHSIAPWPADQLELCFRVPLLARWQQRRRGWVAN